MAMKFKRYDGYVMHVPQEFIDGKLPVCPFCGSGNPHWLLASKMEMSLAGGRTFYQCEQCGATLSSTSMDAAAEKGKQFAFNPGAAALNAASKGMKHQQVGVTYLRVEELGRACTDQSMLGRDEPVTFYQQMAAERFGAPGSTAAVNREVPPAAPASEIPAADGSWLCSCGNTAMGNFCTECGAKRPDAAPQQPVYQQPVYQQPQQPAYQPPVYQQPQQPMYQQPVYQQPQRAPEAPAKKNPSLVACIILAAAALGVYLSALPLTNYLKNYIEMAEYAFRSSHSPYIADTLLMPVLFILFVLACLFMMIASIKGRSGKKPVLAGMAMLLLSFFCIIYVALPALEALTADVSLKYVYRNIPSNMVFYYVFLATLAVMLFIAAITAFAGLRNRVFMIIAGAMFIFFAFFFIVIGSSPKADFIVGRVVPRALLGLAILLFGILFRAKKTA